MSVSGSGFALNDKIQSTMDHARRMGRDPVEALINAGLILTPEAKKKIRLEVLHELRASILNFSPAQFLRRVNRGLEAASPAEMYRAITGYIFDFINQEATNDES